MIVIGAVWFAICRLALPERVANAARHATEHLGVPALDENLDFTPAPDNTVI